MTKILKTILALTICSAAFIVGMRCGIHDEHVMMTTQSEAKEAAMQAKIDDLTEELAYESQIEHVIVDYEYSPLPVDYENIGDLMPDETEATILAKTMWGEYRNSGNYAQAAAVCWCVFNRCQEGGESIEEVATGGQFHGYSASNPVDASLYDIAIDCLLRKQLLEIGANDDVGRVLPEGFLWMEGNGYVNTYRNQYTGGERVTP